MTAALSDMPPGGGWTTDDLDDLPEDGVRRELLDGVLLVSPSPSSVHQIIAGRLMVALEQSCSAAYIVTQAVEVRINPRRSFIPDVLVVTDEAAQRAAHRFAQHEGARGGDRLADLTEHGPDHQAGSLRPGGHPVLLADRDRR
jgi:Uma2 family endonuclease